MKINLILIIRQASLRISLLSKKKKNDKFWKNTKRLSKKRLRK
jgi:hypothetical protein